MAGALLRPAVLDVIDLATHYRSIELKIEELTVAAGGFAAGSTIRQSGLREELGLDRDQTDQRRDDVQPSRRRAHRRGR